jgi:mRNA interferase MazF
MANVKVAVSLPQPLFEQEEALTSHLQRAEALGNVLLDDGEAYLPQRSVVNASQVVTLDKSQLDEKIGTLSARRVRQVLDGLRLLAEPREID